MGGLQSKSSYYKTTSNQLEKDLLKMIADYKFWTDDTICDNIGVFYYDKLIKFHKKDLLDISTGIGIIYKPSVSKKLLCDTIIQNYKAKLDIVKIIYENVIKSSEKIMYATHGPVCRSVDKYIDDFINCKKYNGQWLGNSQYDELLEKFKEGSQYEKWGEHISKLQNKHDEYIEKLLEYIQKLKSDITNVMTLEELVEMKNNVMETVKTFDHITDVLYLLIINID